jgi:hypothetical protein
MSTAFETVKRCGKDWRSFFWVDERVGSGFGFLLELLAMKEIGWIG